MSCSSLLSLAGTGAGTGGGGVGTLEVVLSMELNKSTLLSTLVIDTLLRSLFVFDNDNCSEFCAAIAARTGENERQLSLLISVRKHSFVKSE